MCGGAVHALPDDDTFADCERCMEITWARYVHEVDLKAARDIAAIRDERARKLTEASR